MVLVGGPCLDSLGIDFDPCASSPSPFPAPLSYANYLIFFCFLSSLITIILFIYLFGGYSLVGALRLLISVPSLVAEHGLLGTRASVVVVQASVVAARGA